MTQETTLRQDFSGSKRKLHSVHREFTKLRYTSLQIEEKKVALGSGSSIFGRKRPGVCGMVCIAHVGTRNVSVDRLTPSELGDTTTFIQEKKVAAGKKSPRLR